jgi:hypothetical protein
MKTPKAPEILQISLAEFDKSLLLADAREPGTETFERAVLAHFALKYAQRGWNAAVTVDGEFVRVVAVPEEAVEPKDYVLGLLQHGFLDDALPMLEALDGMLDDAECCVDRLNPHAIAVIDHKPYKASPARRRYITNRFSGFGAGFLMYSILGAIANFWIMLEAHLGRSLLLNGYLRPTPRKGKSKGELIYGIL